jgi:glycerol-3-phosphate O-acyltransferase
MAKKFENISNNNVRIGANGLNGLFSSNTPIKQTEDLSVETAVSTTTRQTFVILAEDLQFIKNIVRTKRMEGDIEFTQKEALHHLIEFYRNNH